MQADQPAPINGDGDAGSAPRVEAISRLLDRPLSEEDLQQQTARVQRPREKARPGGVSAVVFRLGADLLALPTDDVVRVTRPSRVHRIPHRTNQVLRGLVNIEGELVLCASLRDLLGLAEADAAPDEQEGRMIMIGEPSNRWVLLADEVSGVHTIESGDQHPPPMTVAAAMTRFTTSLLQIGDRQAALLDTARIISGLGAALS